MSGNQSIAGPPVAGVPGATAANIIETSRTPSTEPPLREVIVELWNNIEKLMRQEVALASAEIDLKARKLKTEATTMALAGAVLHGALLAAFAAAILLLAQVMVAWLAALLVAVVAGMAGYVLLKRNPMKANELRPSHTIESVKEDVQTLKEAVK